MIRSFQVFALVLSMFVLTSTSTALDVATPIADRRWDGAQHFNVLDYGAIADAVRATGCTIPGMDPCSGSGTGTDNTAAFEAAEAAGIATGLPFVVYVPAGHYRFGVEGARNGNTDAGWKAGSSEMWVQGPGADATFLYPGDSDGSVILNFCPTWNGTTCNMTGNQITDIQVSGITFYDDDPVGHGHWHHIIDANSGLAAGTPAPGDAITWGAGDGAGFVEGWDASGSGTIYIAEGSTDVDDPVDTDAITDGVWTISGILVTSLGTTEESHAVKIRGMRRVWIHDCRFVNIGDEAIDGGSVAGLSNNDLRYINNEFIDSPPFPNGGGGITLDGVDGALVQGNYMTGGHTSYALTASGIVVDTNGAVDSTGIVIIGNHVKKVGKEALGVDGSGASIDHLTIIGNHFEVSQASERAADFTGGPIGSYWVVKGNTFIGGLGGSSLNDVLYEGNIFDDTLSDPSMALELSSSARAQVVRNTFFGGDGGCIRIAAGGSDATLQGNTCLTNVDAVVGEPVIQLFGSMDGDCEQPGVRILDNILLPVGLVGSQGAVVGRSCGDTIARGNRVVIADGHSSAVCFKSVPNVVDNYCENWNNSAGAVVVNGNNYGFSGGLIQGNLIRIGYVNDPGIVLQNNSMGVRVIGNRIEGAHGTGDAIVEASGSDYNVFQGNISAPLRSMGPTTDAVFASGDVTINADPTEDAIDMTNHDFIDGSGPFQLTTSDTLPTGLAVSTDYWINRTDADTIIFSDGPPDWDYIDLSGVGVGNHTIVPQSGVFECLTGADEGCDGNGSGANSEASGNIVR